MALGELQTIISNNKTSAPSSPQRANINTHF